jgi:LPXTG-motif cell wall-anchored protein
LRLVRRLRALFLLLTVAALCLPAPALAQQEPPHGGDNPPPLQGAPPDQSDDQDDAQPAQERGAGADEATGDRRLPATGGEAGLIGLVGAGMVMMGFGLRLRLPGA